MLSQFFILGMGQVLYIPKVFAVSGINKSRKRDIK